MLKCVRRGEKHIFILGIALRGVDKFGTRSENKLIICKR